MLIKPLTTLEKTNMSQHLMDQPTNLPTTDTTPRPANMDYILLDGSGSMIGTKWLDSCHAIDAYVNELGNLETQIITTQFSHHWSAGPQFQELRNCTPRDWHNLAGFAQPLGGGTPLYDAINMMGRSLRDLNPQRCSILIATDGQEADSKTTLVQAKAILDWCRAKGWQVTFIGCDFDNSAQARALGAGRDGAIGVSQARLSDATRELAKKRNLHAQFGAPMHWTESDHEQFGGYLGHNK